MNFDREKRAAGRYKTKTGEKSRFWALVFVKFGAKKAFFGANLGFVRLKWMS